jgi:hypothetical protein
LVRQWGACLPLTSQSEHSTRKTRQTTGSHRTSGRELTVVAGRAEELSFPHSLAERETVVTLRTSHPLFDVESSRIACNRSRAFP